MAIEDGTDDTRLYIEPARDATLLEVLTARDATLLEVLTIVREGRSDLAIHTMKMRGTYRRLLARG